MLTLSRRHVTSDDDPDMVKLRVDAHHITGCVGNVVADLASAKSGQE